MQQAIVWSSAEKGPAHLPAFAESNYPVLPVHRAQKVQYYTRVFPGAVNEVMWA